MARPIEKRELIERGVVEVVARKGLRGTTIQDIADAAKVSPGLLYRYWKNRDALAGDVYRMHLESLLERVALQAAAETTFWGRLGAMLRAFLDFADHNPTVLKFLLLSQHDLYGQVPVDKGIRTFVTSMLDEGMQSGELRKMSPDLATQFVLGLVLQPVVGALYSDLPTPLVRHHGEILDALQRVLNASAAAKSAEPAQKPSAKRRITGRAAS